MDDELMDGFDARLVSLMTSYGDRAVTTYDAAAIARAAFDGRPGARARLAWLLSPRARFMLAIAAIAWLALVAALLVGARHPSPIGDAFASPTAAAWSPDGATLAFVVDVADAADDNRTTAQTAGGGTQVASPGRVSHPELWVVPGDGGNPRRLATLDSMRGSDPTASPPQLAWAVDGRSILIGLEPNGDGSGHSGILTVGLDGSAPRTVLDTGADVIRFDGLSPKDNRLLYARHPASGQDQLYVLDLARRTSTRLASSAAGTWSPDASWVLYANGTEVWVVSEDGATQHRLGTGDAVGWSADGSRAYFQTEGGPMYSASVDGTDVRVVPGLDATYVGWAASPDGSRYVAVTPHGLQIQRPGATPVELTSEGSDSAPTWSPDGAWVAFEGARARAWTPFEGVSQALVGGLYVVPATGGEPRLVVPDATALGDPWRPGTGGTELTLVRDRAIVDVEPDGTGLRELVTRTTIAGDPPMPPAATGQPARIVLGPTGPDRDIYHIAIRDWFQVDVDNRSDIAWVPWGLAEKDSYCRPISGPGYPGNPCGVGPHQVVRFTPSEIPLGRMEIWIAPEGAGISAGFPVILDLEAPP